jgi:glycosyltransferase involved in cell wall biosynthesis
MAAELERLMTVDTVRFGELSPAEAPSALHRAADAAWFTSRVQTLSLVLESLWFFYEAMRSGKPLACGDERLAQMRAALKNSASRR